MKRLRITQKGYDLIEAVSEGRFPPDKKQKDPYITAANIVAKIDEATEGGILLYEISVLDELGIQPIELRALLKQGYLENFPYTWEEDWEYLLITEERRRVFKERRKYGYL